MDRYFINGKLTPVLIGARQINPSNLPSPSWVNQHLQYTHGIGAAVVAGQPVDSATGNPIFVVSQRPARVLERDARADPARHLLRHQRPGLGRGQHQAARARLPGQRRRQRRQPRRDPLQRHGRRAGRRTSSAAWRWRCAWATSTSSSRTRSRRRVGSSSCATSQPWPRRPRRSSPSTPSPTRSSPTAQVQYVLDGYTTTDQYPYSRERRRASNVNEGGLPGELQLRAQLGQGRHQRLHRGHDVLRDDPNDPILKAYRAAFPTMFQPMSSMPTAIRDHLRYPSDLFAVQAATLGRYHITSARRLLHRVGPLGDLADHRCGLARASRWPARPSPTRRATSSRRRSRR